MKPKKFKPAVEMQKKSAEAQKKKHGAGYAKEMSRRSKLKKPPTKT